MGSKSKIGWTNATWNFMRGCTKRVETVMRDGVETKVLSEACRNCYAVRVASNPRLSGVGKAYEGLTVMQNGTPNWTGQIRIVDARMNDPLKWKDPRMIFVNSMGDLFHPKVPWDSIDDALYIMQRANWHTFQVLTKYVDRMLEFYESEPYRRELMIRNRHIWWGISTENQEMFDVRMGYMEKMVLRTKWLSMEPLLGEVNVTKYLPHDFSFNPRDPGKCEDCGQGRLFGMHSADAVADLKWIVMGGESGDRDKIRMSEHVWFRYIRDQARRGGVPVFVKQMSQLELPTGYAEISNFPEDLRVQEWPEALELEPEIGLFA